MGRRTFKVDEICEKMNTVVIPLGRYEELIRAEVAAEMMRKILKTKHEKKEGIYSSDIKLYIELFGDDDELTDDELRELAQMQQALQNLPVEGGTVDDVLNAWKLECYADEKEIPANEVWIGGIKVNTGNESEE